MDEVPTKINVLAAFRVLALPSSDPGNTAKDLEPPHHPGKEVAWPTARPGGQQTVREQAGLAGAEVATGNRPRSQTQAITRVRLRALGACPSRVHRQRFYPTAPGCDLCRSRREAVNIDPVNTARHSDQPDAPADLLGITLPLEGAGITRCSGRVRSKITTAQHYSRLRPSHGFVGDPELGTKGSGGEANAAQWPGTLALDHYRTGAVHAVRC